ncbi:MAG: hypothetical protein ACRDGA_07530, partial [Bacteroidota bacterium]
MSAVIAYIAMPQCEGQLHLTCAATTPLLLPFENDAAEAAISAKGGCASGANKGSGVDTPVRRSAKFISQDDLMVYPRAKRTGSV